MHTASCKNEEVQAEGKVGHCKMESNTRVYEAARRKSVDQAPAQRAASDNPPVAKLSVCC